MFTDKGDIVVVHNGEETKFAMHVDYAFDKPTGLFRVVARFDTGSAFAEERRKARRSRLYNCMVQRMQQVAELRQFEEAAAIDEEMKKFLEEYRQLNGVGLEDGDSLL